MKQFMDENFLLDTKTAQDLYHNHAATTTSGVPCVPMV